MKDFNKILYDILLKIELSEEKKSTFDINHNLVSKYFDNLKDPKSTIYIEFRSYFRKFYDFCFDKSLDNMVREALNFKY